MQNVSNAGISEKKATRNIIPKKKERRKKIKKVDLPLPRTTCSNQLVSKRNHLIYEPTRQL